MSYSHFRSLLYKLGRLQQRIEDTQKARNADPVRILQMKKLRLKIKDRLMHAAHA